MCQKYIIFQPKDFEELLAELKPLWMLPRNYPKATRMRKRKHGIDASFISTFCVIRCGHTLHQAEGSCAIDEALIDIDVHRNVDIINNVLDYEMQWPSHEEQLYLVQVNPEFNSCLIIDCMDCKIQKCSSDWYGFIFKSWKVGQGYRNLLVVDNKGEIRAATSIPAGFNNDQTVLRICNFFRKGSLAPNTTAFGDGAFTGNSDFPIDTPFNKPQQKLNPWLKHYNRAISKHKNIVEHVNGILTMQWGILQKPFKYSPSFFPAVFRCCCLLTNRYFRLYGYPGNK